jgi:hypothetical protein
VTDLDRRDISRALSAVLAVYREQSKAGEIAAQVWALGAGEEFTAALLTAFATLLTVKVDDVEAYLLAWIACELDAADAAEPPDE